MIVLMLNLKVTPSTRKDAVNIFESLAGSVSAKPGCNGVKLYSDINNDDDLLLIEEWHSKAEIEKYIGSDEFRKIMALMDMADEPPTIHFHTVSSNNDFKIVEKIRENVNKL